MRTLISVAFLAAVIILSGCSTIRSTCCWWTIGQSLEDEQRTLAELAENPETPMDRPGGVEIAEVEPDMVTIYFDFDESFIRPAGLEYLRTLGSWLRRHESVRIKIEGNTCKIGEADYNVALGERRARIAKQFLVDMGVAASRIEIVSYGEEQPASLNLPRNRRDDFFIINR